MNFQNHLKLALPATCFFILNAISYSGYSQTNKPSINANNEISQFKASSVTVCNNTKGIDSMLTNLKANNGIKSRIIYSSKLHLQDKLVSTTDLDKININDLSQVLVFSKNAASENDEVKNLYVIVSK